jgi:hypothetical protein
VCARGRGWSAVRVLPVLPLRSMATKRKQVRARLLTVVMERHEIGPGAALQTGQRVGHARMLVPCAAERPPETDGASAQQAIFNEALS